MVELAVDSYYEEFEGQFGCEHRYDVDNMVKRMRFYQYHPDGACRWLEDHVRVAVEDFETGALSWVYLKDLTDEIHPETGRSYKQFWEWQKEHCIRPAVRRDEHGKYIYHTICFCFPRGEGKSYIMNLLILYRFFTQPKQLIILAANSKDQSSFVSFDNQRSE